MELGMNIVPLEATPPSTLLISCNQ